MLNLVYLQGDFVNDKPIHECAFIFAKILWVMKYTINSGPIHEWVSASYNYYRKAEPKEIEIKYVMNGLPLVYASLGTTLIKCG